MKKSNQKSRSSKPTRVLCQERFACTDEGASAVVNCVDCKTFQCESCQTELHKDGDCFFHRRNLLDHQYSSISNNTNRSSEKSTEKKTQHSAAVSQSKDSIVRGNSSSKLSTGASNPYLATLVKSPNSESEPKLESELIPGLTSASQTSKSSVASSSFNNAGDYSCSPSLKPLVLQQPDYPEDRDLAETYSKFKETEGDNLDTEGAESDQFHSLSIDLILSAEVDIGEMKGSSKKTRKKASSSSSKEPVSGNSNSDPESFTIDAEADFYSAHDSDNNSRSRNGFLREDLDSGSLKDNHDEDIVTDLMQSVTQSQMAATLSPADQPKASHDSKTQRSTKAQALQTGETSSGSKTRNQQSSRSFLLIDEAETIQVGTRPQVGTSSTAFQFTCSSLHQRILQSLSVSLYVYI